MRKKISIIIPVYNQAERLHLTLHSFRYQTCGMDAFEVVAVDDGSNDDTSSVVHSLSLPYHLEYIYQTNRGRSAARNHGVKKATGNILIFNDADRAVSPNFVSAHLERHECHPDIVAVGAIYEFYFGDLSLRHTELLEDISHGYTKFGRLAREFAYAKAVQNMFDSGGRTQYHIPWISLFSGNMSLKRETFTQVGGFDEGFVDWGFEHFEFGLRLYKAGIKYIFEPLARNYHFAHQREQNFYRNKIQNSFEYFKKKYPGEPIELLVEFLSGRLSLQEYEARISGIPVEKDGGAGVILPKLVRISL